MIWTQVAAVAAALAVGAAYWQGRQDGRAAEQGAAARDEALVQRAGQAAADSAAKAIARLQVRHTTIRQETEREVQVRTEYRDCRHRADQLQRLNAALSGEPAASGPAGAGGLP